MNQLLQIYLDILCNFFDCLFFLRFSQNQLQQKISLKSKFIYFSVYFIYAFLPIQAPYSVIICFLFDTLFLSSFLYPNFKKIILIFVKYDFFSYAFLTLILFTHTFIFNDTDAISTSPLYQTYNSITVCFLLYVFYALYTNTKKMQDFHNHYQIYFNLIIVGISLMLSYVTLYVCIETPNSYVLPVIFATIALLIVIYISLYDKFLTLLTENTHYKIQSEIDRMKQEYATHIEENLKNLHSLRHDIKNHLIIIDGYASQQNYDNIHEYISRITQNFSGTSLIKTSSPLVSALLNAKYHSAQRQQIDCTIITDFPYVHIDDFSITTILGNLLDNAITAATKCSKGWIKVALQQSDSYLEITIDNNHMEHIQKKNGSFISTKTDKNLFHGIGIKNVRKVVHTLNGQIDISYSKNTFHVCILIPNYD